MIRVCHSADVAIAAADQGSARLWWGELQCRAASLLSRLGLAATSALHAAAGHGSRAHATMAWALKEVSWALPACQVFASMPGLCQLIWDPCCSQCQTLQICLGAQTQMRPGLTSIQQLQQHIVHSAVGVGGDQHRGSCSYEALDHSHHGGALACAWHAHHQRAASSLVHHPARAEPSALSCLLAMRGVQAPLLTPSCAVVQAKQWQIAAEHMDLACHAGGLH